MEYVIRYPQNVLLYVIDEDIIVLTYLAVLFRAIFHLMAGIGIARIQNWCRMWLSFGWPVMIVITYGLIYSVFSDWRTEGYVGGIFEILAWPKLIIYFALITFDLMFVKQSIKAINKETKG